MVHVRVGIRVVRGDRVFVVRGVSPMSLSKRRVLLEDAETHELVEANIEDVHPVPDDEAGEGAGGRSG